MSQNQKKINFSRREFSRNTALGLGAICSWPLLGNVSLASGVSDKIFVVLELSGGNDGLNTVVPYGDDAYYRHRPNLGISEENLLKLDEYYGLHQSMRGVERLYKDGKVAIVHGCGYKDPSFSHFTSLSYWHTAAPNSGEEYGWLGRLADKMDPVGSEGFLINIDKSQSLAVRSRRHLPVVFDEPSRFVRKATYEQTDVAEFLPSSEGLKNPTRRFLVDAARSARNSAELVRDAWESYSTPVDYGLVSLDLPKIASLIAAGMSSRLYYTTFRNFAFDTHVHQANLHSRLLTYASDAISGFYQDLVRLGRAEDVVLLVFSEFGRRVPENTNLGTDHGAANALFVIGENVKGGHYGDRPSLTELDPGDNLIYTTDFRQVYASIIENWFDVDPVSILHDEFATLDLFGS